MPQLNLVRSVQVVRSPRVMQVEGIFDVPPAERSEKTWTVSLPIEDWNWSVGLIVGASGSGKSTIAREAFGRELIAGYDWPADRSIVDGFPAEMSIRDITAALSSVGFSSPPSWMRPFHCLSNGEQFRVTLARAISEPGRRCVIDEFTSVVDRTVAQVGSAAVAKAVRRAGKQFVAVTCHYDVIDWLDPDWVLEMPNGEFTRRTLRSRPAITLEIARVHRSAWRLFQSHHYMSADQHPGAIAFVAFLASRPVGYCSVIHFPHAIRPGWKEHRTVVLPDFQGVGIGNALSDYVASLFTATGKPYRDTTAHPGHVQYRIRSPLWKVTRNMSRMRGQGKNTTLNRGVGTAKTMATNRLTMSFEYVGPSRPTEARRFGLL